MSGERFMVDDVIRAGGCPSGIRRWFTSRGDALPEGVTLRSFIREGMSLAQAKSCNDAFIERALTIKETTNGR